MTDESQLDSCCLEGSTTHAQRQLTMATLTTVHSVDHLENMQQRKIVEGSRSPFQVSSAECSEDDENTNIKSNVSVTVNETEASTSTWRVNYEVKGSTPQMERSILDVSIKPIIGDPAEKSREKGEKYKARERKRVLELFEGSDYDFPDDEFPTFKEKELIVGRLLGRGAFCDVLEIPLIRCVENECSKELKRSDSFAVDNAESRLFVAKHCVRECGDARYAMKLPQTTISCSAQYWTSVADLVTETRFLSHLEHPNIIKLRAVADVLDPFTRKYFILIDRLYDTLAARLKKWRLQWKKSSSFVNRIMHRSNRKCHFEERLVAALDLSSALEYIHSKQICHRDIKPENIGFDIVSVLSKKIQPRECRFVFSQGLTPSYHFFSMCLTNF